MREFENGQAVLVRDYMEGRKQTKENYTVNTGPQSYQIKINGST